MLRLLCLTLQMMDMCAKFCWKQICFVTKFVLHLYHKLNMYDKELFDFCLNFFANPNFFFANPGQSEQRVAGRVWEVNNILAKAADISIESWSPAIIQSTAWKTPGLLAEHFVQTGLVPILVEADKYVSERKWVQNMNCWISPSHCGQSTSRLPYSYFHPLVFVFVSCISWQISKLQIW